MNDELEKTILDIKTPGINNPETYVLTHNMFITYKVLILSDLNKAQKYKIPYRNSPHQEIEIVISFDYLNVFEPNEHTEDYHIKKTDDEIFLFEIEKKTFISEIKFFLPKQMIYLKNNFQNSVITRLNTHMHTVKKIFTLCYIKKIFLF